MMKRILALYALLLLAAPAAAEWTSEEEADLLKIVASQVDAAKIYRRIGADILPFVASDATRPALTAALGAVEATTFKCGVAFANLGANHTGGDTSFPPAREVLVAQGIVKVAECAAGFGTVNTALDGLLGLGRDPHVQIAKTLAQDAANRLGSFDGSLTFTDWQPPAFPRITGTHGDQILASHFLARANHYFIQTLDDYFTFTAQVPVFSSDAYADLSTVITQGANAHEHLWRTIGMDARIVLPDDAARINASMAAGSGIRGFDFFLGVLQVEYMFNRGLASQVAGGSMVLFDGRTAGTGFGADVGNMGQAFANMVRKLHQVNDLATIRQWWTAGATSHGSLDPNGRLVEAFRDYPDFWRDSDAWGAALMLFFHAVPGPPCAPGTHSENGQCVADGGGIEECPEYIAELVKLDMVHAEARCVPVQ